MSGTGVKYVLLTDAPPLKEGGHGCHVLAWNWLVAMQQHVKLAVTHRLNPTLDLSRIAADLPVPVSFYPDLSRIRWPVRWTWMKSMIEPLLVFFSAGKWAKVIEESGADRIFAFFGGNAWFLWTAAIVARRARLPLDVYLVDDLEQSCRLEGHWILGLIVRWMEPRVLRRADRVFVISPGYGEHLRAKYDISSEWLPIPFARHEVIYRKYSQSLAPVREITYLGAVNPLYTSALLDFLRVIDEWNGSGRALKIKLLILTYSEPDEVRKHLGDFSSYEVRHKRSNQECTETMGNSWAIFLPYSFDESMRTMVTTSFPSRLAECMTVGRPLLVYGPPYASLPRYFLENDLRLCAQSISELKSNIANLDRIDCSERVEDYQAVVKRYHTKEAIESRLAIAGFRPKAPCY